MKQDNQSKLFAIHPTCPECNRDLVTVSAGLVCPEGHGRIVPLDEYTDRSDLPINFSRCKPMKQRGIGTICREVEKAIRAANRLEKREAKQRKEQDDE